MPLDEVKPGMEGEWRTVVSGAEVQSFRLRVIGIARNFIGPKRDVIICEALDADQVLSGPVSGMSGSPVYIDGKLVGAYAYGFPYSKEQAILGVQPIEHMLETLDYPDGSQETTPSVNLRPTEAQIKPMGDAFVERADWRMVRGALPTASAVRLDQALRPLPLALVTSGISARTLDVFSEQTAQMGLQLVQGAGSGASDQALPLEPGNAVAGVLMSGDFGVAGTGTVTWREGDSLLAFGHPFFQWGAVDMPMAGAEIITVVRSIVSSFKLSNPGKVVGSIYQDRQTAIAGEIGRKAKTTALKIAVETPVQGRKEYAAEVIRDFQFTPLMLAISLLESTSESMVAERRQHVDIEATLEIADYGTLAWRSTGGMGARQPVLDFYFQIGEVMRNPFELPVIEHADFQVTVREGWALNYLRESRLLNGGEIRPGDQLRLNVSLEQAQGALERKTLELTLPKDLAAGNYHVSIADADTLRQWRDGSRAETRQFDSLADYLDYMNAAPRNDRIYLVLWKQAEGLRYQGQTMLALPQSARDLIIGGDSFTPYARTHRLLLTTEAFPVEGEFIGTHTFPLEITR